MSDLCCARFPGEDGDCICHEPAFHSGPHECENCGWEWPRDDTGRVVGYLAEPRTVTAEEVESALWAWIESVTEGVTRETVSPRVLDRNRPRVLAVIRALGLTVEGDDQ